MCIIHGPCGKTCPPESCAVAQKELNFWSFNPALRACSKRNCYSDQNGPLGKIGKRVRCNQTLMPHARMPSGPCAPEATASRGSGWSQRANETNAGAVIRRMMTIWRCERFWISLVRYLHREKRSKGQRDPPSEWRYRKRTGLSYCMTYLFSATRATFVGQMTKKSICITPVSEWLGELDPDDGARGRILGETVCPHLPTFDVLRPIPAE